MLILALNCGGSTLKFKLLRLPEEVQVARGSIDRLATPQATLRIVSSHGDCVAPTPNADHLTGMRHLLHSLTEGAHAVLSSLAEIDAVAHKLAHGGDRYSGSVRIDEEVIATLDELSPLVPLHNPPNAQGIRVVRELLPAVPQFGSFETSFHQTVPLSARAYGLPYSWLEQNHIKRYGFHSASHRYVASRVQVPRLISCHLGSGTSVCAIKDGASFDITSGLTPQSGTIMSTRPGDFDPFAIFAIMRARKLTVDEMEHVLTYQSGLLGISGLTGDMRDLEAAAANGHAGAQLAIEVFCLHVRRSIGAFHAELGGLEALTFTAGIGENSSAVRERICEPLSHLGITLDLAVNRAAGDERTISSLGSRVQVRVIPTDEEIVIARDAFLLRSAS